MSGGILESTWTRGADSTRLALGLWAVLLAAPGCGGPECGNGMPEMGEPCDDGNLVDDDLCTNACTRPGELELTLVWDPLLANEFPGFDESCSGVEADEMEISLAGPVNHTFQIDCSAGRTPVRGLPPGDYTIGATLLRPDEDAMGLVPVTRRVETSVSMSSSTEVRIDFTLADFLESYKGAFFFRIRYAGMDTCAAAEVAEQKLRLERNGEPLEGTDRDGNPVVMDGMVPVPCKDFGAPTADFVKEITWGPATFTIIGLNDKGKTIYEGTFDTFVGAGINNPEMHFDVGPDAGPPDAAPADAAWPDAM